MEELRKLIFLIQEQYDYINNKWIREDWYFPLNMKQKRVEDIYNNEELLLYVFDLIIGHILMII